MNIRKFLKKLIKLKGSLFLKTFFFLFLPLIGFIIFSFLTYPLRPHCSLGNGLLGCTPMCEPASYFEEGRLAGYKVIPCYHGDPDNFQKAIFKNWFLIPFLLFVVLSLWIYKEGVKRVIKKLMYIALAPIYIFKENRENKNFLSRLLVILMLFFMTTEWALGYYVAGTMILGKEPFNFSVSPSSQITSSPSFTGQEVFEAVNRYRKENNIPELKIDEVLCNNIAQRYLDIKSGEKENIAHKGFDEWYKKYAEPYGYTVSENYACGQTPEDVIKAWSSSPSHNLSILDKKNKLACTYAADGCAVILLGYKTSSSQVKGAQTQIDSDPIVDCQINPECGGGSKKMKLSECNQMTCCLIHKNCGGGGRFMTKSDCNQTICCQIGGKWYFYLDKNKCTEDQKNYQSSIYIPQSNFSTYSSSPQYYPCTICYPSLGTCSTYNYLYKTKEECDAAQQSINQNYNTNTTPQYYSSPQINIETITKKECQDQVNEKYRKLAIQYGCAYPCPETGDCGTSSVCDALWYQAKKEMRNCNQYP